MSNRIGAGLERWTRIVLRWPRLTVAVVLLVSGLGLNHARQNLEIRTDTADMMSASLEWRRDFIAYREAFGLRNNNIVAVVDADTDAGAARFARRLARALRDEPESFRSVFLAGDGAFFERNGLLYLSVDELEDLSDRLAEAQPLVGMIAERGNGSGVIDTLTRTVEDAGAEDTEGLDRLYAEVSRTLRAAADGGAREVDWRSLIDEREVSVEQRMILIEPVPGDAVRPARAALERLREVAGQLAADAPGRPAVRLTGTIAMEDEELQSVVDGARFAGVASLVLVTAVLLVTLRSVGLLVIALVTLLSGLAGTAAFAAVTVGELNLLSVAFAVLYVGLGVDFILHIVLRVRELQRESHGRDAAITGAMRGVGSSLVICAITTAAGFFAFVPTAFVGVSQLGLISGGGMFLSLLASVTILPALLGLFLSTPAAPPARPAGSGAGSRAGFRRPGTVLAVCAVLVAAGAALLPRVDFDSNPVRLRDPNAESIVVLESLAEEGNAGFMSLVALAGAGDPRPQWLESLAGLPEVAGVRTIDSLVPAEQDEKLLLLDDMALMLGPGFGAFERGPADAFRLRESLRLLRSALGQRAEPSPAELELMAAVDALLQRGAGDSQLEALDARLVGDLPEELERLASGLPAGRFGVDELPDDLVRRWRAPGGVELIEIAPSGNINDAADAEAFVDAVRSVVPRATGLPVVHAEASKTVVDAFTRALGYAFAAVTAILLIFMRSFRDCVLILVPILCAAIVTAGATVALGLSFNFANIIALPLLVGVGVDSGIHMVHRMRTEPAGGGVLGTSTSRAVLASIVTTIASFGNLAFSAHRGMSSMGILLTLGMLVTLAATLSLLPALIRFSEQRRWIS